MFFSCGEEWSTLYAKVLMFYPGIGDRFLLAWKIVVSGHSGHEGAASCMYIKSQVFQCKRCFIVLFVTGAMWPLPTCSLVQFSCSLWGRERLMCWVTARVSDPDMPRLFLPPHFPAELHSSSDWQTVARPQIGHNKVTWVVSVFKVAEGLLGMLSILLQ